MKSAALAIFFIGFLALGAFGQEAKLMLPIGHSGDVFGASFSPDSKMVATPSEDKSVKIWDAKTGALLSTLIGHTNGVVNASFSPDSKKIVTASWDHSAKIWDVETGAVLRTLKGHSSDVIGASFSVDGKKIVTASADSYAKIWDVQTGLNIITLRGHTNIVRSALFSNDGKKIVTMSDDHTVKVWDSKTGHLLANLAETDDWGDAVPSFSPDGKTVVTGSTTNIAKIWDAQTGHILVKLGSAPFGTDNAVSFSPDGSCLLTCCDNTIQVWDVKTGVCLINLHSLGIRNGSFSPDGKEFVISSIDGTGEIWAVQTKQRLVGFRAPRYAFWKASFSPDGANILMIPTQLPIGSRNISGEIWDAKTGTLLATLKSHTSSINSASFSPDGKKIIIASDDHTAKIWDVQTGILESVLKGHKETVNDARFSPDGTKIVTGSDDYSAKIWDAQTGMLLTNIDMWDPSDAHHVIKVNFFPDSKKIVTVISSSPGAITTEGSAYLGKIWDIKTGALGPNSFGYFGHFLFSSDGSKILTSIEDTAKIWDTQTGKHLIDIKASEYDITSLSLSADNRKIITTARDGAKIWNAQTGVLVSKLETGSNIIISASFSPDGKKIAAALTNNTISLWDAQTLAPFADLKGHTNDITGISFSQDGKKLVTSSKDNTSKIWNAETGKLLYTFFAVDSTDYLVTDAYGRYDGTEGARKLLYFTCGTEAISLDQVKDQLWVPNLAERIMKGDIINAKKLSDLDICGLVPHVDAKEESSRKLISISPNRGGLGETVVYVNNIEVKRYKPSQLTKTATGYELNVDEKELQPYFIAGQQNPVTVKTYTAKNDISSRGAEIIQDETKKKSVAPNLYAVMIGVSDYKGPELQLKYAAKDAEDISAAISASAKKLLDTAGGKEHVFMYNLTTGKNHYELPEKIAIKNLFGEIGKKATANDILLIFFAGHGVTSGEKKQFYFLTADASQSSATDAPAEVGISTTELSEWMQPSSIKAQKRILILDACNSGQAIKELVKVGADGQNYLAARNDDKAEQIKAIDKLNEKSGLFILAASASNQSAYEMGRYSQGLLTYSLLKAIKQQPDILEDNKYLNVSRWFNAAEKTVSDMVRETGNRQEPQIVSAGNFNIGVVDQDVMTGIKLANEKPLFTASNLQNNDPDIAADDLHLNSLLDNQLNEISARGENNGITYIPGSTSPDAYSLGGRYILNGDVLTVKVNIRQNDVSKYKFELTGTKSEMKALAEKVVSQAADWITIKK